MDNKYRVPYVTCQDSNYSFYASIKHLAYKVEKLKKGKIICVDDPNQIIFINKGRLKLVISNYLGGEGIVYYFTENNFCMPYGPELLDILSLIVDENCELTYFNKNDIIDVASDDFIVTIEQRVIIMLSNIFAMQCESSRNRIYQLIYHMALNNQKVNEEGAIEISDFPSNSDISLFTGVHRTNVSKYITELDNMSIIEKKRHGILVKNMGKLESLIEAEYEN